MSDTNTVRHQHQLSERMIFTENSVNFFKIWLTFFFFPKYGVNESFLDIITTVKNAKKLLSVDKNFTSILFALSLQLKSKF